MGKNTKSFAASVDIDPLAGRENDMNAFFDDWDGETLDWDEIAFLGVLSEDIARKKRDRERARREWEDDDGQDDFWEWLNRK